MGRSLRNAAGLLLIGAGVIGTVLPLIPGFPFLVAGAALLGPDHALVRPFADRIRRWKRSGKPPGQPRVGGPAEPEPQGQEPS